MKDKANLFPIILATAVLLFGSKPAQADQYRGNGNTGFGGVIGNGTLTLSDDGTNISGTLTAGGNMNDVLVLYIQSGTGGFADTSGFNDQGDYRCQAISGVSASGRSLLTFASGFQPNYAIVLGPSAVESGSLWQLANGGNGSMVYLGSVNLAPLNNTGPYTFSFPAALIGMIPGVRSTIQVFGTYVRADGYRSTEAIAGDLTSSQGWNPFTQTAYAGYTFDAGAVVVKLSLGVWAGGSANPPAARMQHTAVWTGSEMIVWGGLIAISPYYVNDGARYNPVANTWTALPCGGAPAGRKLHTAVWTGSEMIVWGGYNGSRLNDGARYDPVAGRWTALCASGAPSARDDYTVVWTGSEMIIWGGLGWIGNTGTPRNDGARYNPATDSWAAMSISGAPTARYRHTAVWTGSEMIVWGGSAWFNDGGRYNPTANTWTALSTNGAPAGREQHKAVWTGSEMIVWGGLSNSTYYADGARYNPLVDAWTKVPNTLPNTPTARTLHTTVWTGNDMIVWGGYHNGTYYGNGGRYNPTANTWTSLPNYGPPPTARDYHTAVWTGSEMIVWGGWDGSSYFNNGSRYNPTADRWAALPTSGAPAARSGHTAVWTGSEMIIWGGYNSLISPSYLNGAGRYSPVANVWTALATNGAPVPRQRHTAVWTGTEMIIWGGCSSLSIGLNDGGRYNPVADTWTALPTNGAPLARQTHTAVWTGSEMIVWGGTTGSADLNDGGRYDPALNSWAAVPTSGAPAARENHTAVWTGSEMIVWGGYNGSRFNDGGRYSPLANNWTAVPAVGAPAPRSVHTAVWTGGEMVVWGGWNGTSDLNDGGRYNPAANSWTALPTVGAPVARDGHTAVWTGSEMIVWGGYGGSDLNDGGRYNPSANYWAGLPNLGAPAARHRHTAVWTGSQMILFGGSGYGGCLSDTWSYYPYAPAVRVSRAGPTSTVVAWPVWSSTLRLCQTTNVLGPWTTVTSAVTRVGAENHVTVSPLSGGQFFRAVYP